MTLNFCLQKEEMNGGKERRRKGVDMEERRGNKREEGKGRGEAKRSVLDLQM